MDIHKFNLLEDKIEVFIWDIEKPVIVDKNDFEDWLMKEGKLDWILDWQVDGVDMQESGTMNANDYWNNSIYSEKVSDLNEYLKSKK